MALEIHILNIYKAFYLWHQNQPNEAQSIVQKSAPILLENKVYLEYSLGIIILSLIDWAKGNVESAFFTIHKAFDDFLHHKDTVQAQNRLHWVLGVFYYDLNELDKSDYHYKQCYDSIDREADPSLVAYTQIGLASVLAKKMDIGAAQTRFEETLKYSKKHAVWMVEARAYHELGILAKHKKEYTKAIELIDLSYMIRLENNAMPSLVSSILSIVEIYVLQQQYDKALKKLEYGLEIAVGKNLKPKLSNIYLMFSQIYEHKKQFESSLLCLKKHNELEKELKNNNLNNKKNYLILNYKAQKAEKESALQKSVNEELIKANNLIKQQTNRLSERNREKETLLKEIHHRVKNNLQIITSLLSLQSLNIKNNAIKELFSNSQHRINSMALIHEMLYQTNNLAEINFKEYMQQLIESLIRSYKGNNNTIDVRMKVPRIHLNIDTAIPLGLLINEVLTNALKYAYNSDELGILWVSIEKNDPVYFRLRIGDNGPGLPPALDIKRLDSLGLKLIERLIRQLKGKIQMDTSKTGTHYIIDFQEVQ